MGLSTAGTGLSPKLKGLDTSLALLPPLNENPMEDVVAGGAKLKAGAFFASETGGVLGGALNEKGAPFGLGSSTLCTVLVVCCPNEKSPPPNDGLGASAVGGLSRPPESNFEASDITADVDGSKEKGVGLDVALGA